MEKLQYKGRYVYNWFSNFEPIQITIDGVTYPSVENYYQSQKTIIESQRKQFITCTPSESKKLGRKITLRSDWDQVKFDIMEKALRIKFTPNTTQGKKLMDTKDEIVEWNNWGDRIWGKTLDNQGQNHLGKILMKIRDDLNKQVLFS